MFKNTKTRKTPEENLTYRSITVRAGEPSTLNDEERSIEITLATENPSLVFDFNRYEIVNEVLVVAGAQLPGSRQIPMLNVHSRYDAADVLGSIRDLKKSGQELIGRAVFSTADSVSDIWTKVREGHLTDFSAGYKSIDSQYVAEGEKYNYRGVTYEGPILVTKKWKIREGSVVPIGADEFATARAASNQNSNPNKEVDGMDKKTREYLISRGLAENATEEEAYEFMATLDVKREAPPEQDPSAEVDIEKIRAEARGEEIERIDEILGLGVRFDCVDMSRKMIKGETSIIDAKAAMAEEVLKRSEKEDNTRHMPPATIIEDGVDKFRAAAEDSLIMRSSTLTVETPAPGADELNGYSMRELARECLRNAGKSPKGHALEMVGRAMTTTDFPLIMANVANKSLANGWETAPETWRVWCGVGSVSDFKTNSRPRMSEFDDLEEVPEHGEYNYGKFTEAQEQYSIVTYGKLFAITRQAVINDDLDAITMVPSSRGEAAARKVGDVAYAVLTANAAMGDGVALFHADHSNFVANGSGAAPGVTTMAAAELAMGLQTDLRGLRQLNIRAAYMMAPMALKSSSEIFFRTQRFSDHSTVATDSSFASTRDNIYADYLERVYDARLDASDSAAWFLAAPKGETVTVFFLNGIQSPYTEQQAGWTVDGTEFKVRIDCGAKALNWVGLYMNDGN